MSNRLVIGFWILAALSATQTCLLAYLALRDDPVQVRGRVFAEVYQESYGKPLRVEIVRP